MVLRPCLLSPACTSRYPTSVDQFHGPWILKPALVSINITLIFVFKIIYVKFFSDGDPEVGTQPTCTTEVHNTGEPEVSRNQAFRVSVNATVRNINFLVRKRSRTFESKVFKAKKARCNLGPWFFFFFSSR